MIIPIALATLLALSPVMPSTNWSYDILRDPLAPEGLSVPEAIAYGKLEFRVVMVPNSGTNVYLLRASVRDFPSERG